MENWDDFLTNGEDEPYDGTHLPAYDPPTLPPIRDGYRGKLPAVNENRLRFLRSVPLLHDPRL
jgi:hypothetical protein